MNANNCRKIGWFVGFPLLFLTLRVSEAGTDVLLTKSGDRLVGEIQKLEHGLINFETDYGDNVFVIEWDKVRRLESKAYFSFRTSRGERYTGSFQTDPTDSSAMRIDDPRGTVRLLWLDLVYLESVKSEFLSRFSGSLDFGYTFTKANELQQLVTRGTVGYRSERFMVDIAVNAISSTQKGADRSRKGDAGLSHRYFFLDEWYTLLSVLFETSDEQLLDLRSSGSLGIGAYIVSTQHLELTIAGGASFVHEQFQHADSEPLTSAESFVTAEFNAFNLGDLSFITSLSMRPSLTEPGRVRSKLSADLKWDLPLDFTFKVGLTHNYDSKPPNEAAKTDYVFSTTLGWEL